jgi:hypothetical protein
MTMANIEKEKRKNYQRGTKRAKAETLKGLYREIEVGVR